MPLNAKLAAGVVLTTVLSGISLQQGDSERRVFPKDSMVYAKKDKPKDRPHRLASCIKGIQGWLTIGTRQIEVYFSGEAWIEVMPNMERRARRENLDERFPSRVVVAGA